MNVDEIRSSDLAILSSHDFHFVLHAARLNFSIFVFACRERMCILMTTRFECVIYFTFGHWSWKRTTVCGLRCECNVGDQERLEMCVVITLVTHSFTTVFPAYLFIYFVACTCHIGHFSIVVPLFLPFRRFVFSFNEKLCSYANRKQNWFMNDQLCYCCPSNCPCRFVLFSFVFNISVSHLDCQNYFVSSVVSITRTHSCSILFRRVNGVAIIIYFIVHFMFKRLKMSARPLSHGTQSEDTCSS